MAGSRSIPLTPEELYVISYCLKQIWDDLEKEGENYRGVSDQTTLLDEDEYETLKSLQIKF